MPWIVLYVSTSPTPQIQSILSKILKTKGEKETESHTRAVISTVARYAFWIGIWDCVSPELFNQQPRGIFIFPPAQRAGMTEVAAFIATPLHY